MRGTREIPGLYRVVELRDDGTCKQRYGVNFRTQTEAVDYAEGYLGLPRPDLDVLGWHVDGRRFEIQTQKGPARPDYDPRIDYPERYADGRPI